MALPEEWQTKDSRSPVRSGNRQCEQVFPCRRRAVFRDSDLVSHQDINSHIFNFRSGETPLVGAMQRKPPCGRKPVLANGTRGDNFLGIRILVSAVG